MQEYWEGYMKPIEGHPAMISFNAGVADNVPDMEFIYVGFVKVKLQNPKEDGLVSKDEADDVGFIEDRLEMESLRYRAGKYIGRIITQGEVNFVYYLKLDFEWADTVTAAMKHFPEYNYEFGSRIDMEWEVYQKLLFPNVREWQIIANHNACNRLIEQGDNLRVQRAIEHKIYFNSQEDRDKFVDLITADGFKVQKELEANQETNMIGLQFYRIDTPYYYDIDELTMKLIDLGESCNAQYDGWETSLVKI
jgi:regulator of RNase E activity RraB